MKEKRRVFKMLICSMILVVLLTVPAYATGLESSKLVTGTNKLISDGTKVLTGIIAGLTGIVIIKDIVQWLMAEDEEKPKGQKRLTRDFGIGVMGTVGVGLVAVILSYYQ